MLRHLPIKKRDWQLDCRIPNIKYAIFSGELRDLGLNVNVFVFWKIAYLQTNTQLRVSN